MNDTFERIVKICSEYEHNGLPVTIKYSDDTLYGDLGLDSLAVVEIAMLCEKEFGVLLDDDKIEKMRTVNDLVNLINKEICI